MKGNPFVSKVDHYRKVIIHKLKHLTFLDDRPVSLNDHRCADAYIRGGVEAEKEERKKIETETRAKGERNMDAWKAMQAQAKERREAQRGGESISETPSNDQEKNEANTVANPSSLSSSLPSSQSTSSISSSTSDILPAEKRNFVSYKSFSDRKFRDHEGIQVNADKLSTYLSSSPLPSQQGKKREEEEEDFEWNSSSDSLLLQLCEEHGFNFHAVSGAISQNVGERITESECRLRFAEIDADFE